MDVIKLTPWKETAGSVAHSTSKSGSVTPVETPISSVVTKPIMDSVNFRGNDSEPVTNPSVPAPAVRSMPISGNSLEISNTYALQARGLRPYV